MSARNDRHEIGLKKKMKLKWLIFKKSYINENKDKKILPGFNIQVFKMTWKCQKNYLKVQKKKYKFKTIHLNSSVSDI